MTSSSFQLIADVSSASPAAIRPILDAIRDASIVATSDGFHVEATFPGTDARELNRELLSALRRVERRTRLRAQWTAHGMTHRFFDYVPKGSHPAD